jgi:hypothetical protein
MVKRKQQSTVLVKIHLPQDAHRRLASYAKSKGEKIGETAARLLDTFLPTPPDPLRRINRQTFEKLSAEFLDKTDES